MMSWSGESIKLLGGPIMVIPGWDRQSLRWSPAFTWGSWQRWLWGSAVHHVPEQVMIASRQGIARFDSRDFDLQHSSRAYHSDFIKTYVAEDVIRCHTTINARQSGTLIRKPKQWPKLLTSPGRREWWTTMTKSVTQRVPYFKAKSPFWHYW